jgi:hypothetical protein
MNIGDLIIWKRKIFSYIDEQELGFSQDVGLLIDILEVDILVIQTFKGERLHAPSDECSLWSCSKNPGCYCGACHP